MTITPKHDKNLIVRVFIGKQNQLKQNLSFSHEKNIHLLGLEPGSSSMEVGHVTPRLFSHMMTFSLKTINDLTTRGNFDSPVPVQTYDNNVWLACARKPILP